MAWPTAQDYNEAIQSPAINFADPELKGGVAELNSFGIPKPITGGFASVYRLNCLKRSWAIRCFLREFSDQQERYSAVSSHLHLSKLEYTVGFEFQQRGILISGQWYPILKMEWVSGQLLNQFVEANLGNSSVIANLAKSWARMMIALRAANVAHGDLQHGNVVVSNGNLRLIDYDGMFVPHLSGRISNEVGHRNYQHPLRSASDFGCSTDDFSAWVIYISLLLLSLDPKLWSLLGAGDEFLIFQRDDYSDPGHSKTFHVLGKHFDPRVQAIADIFRPLLYLPLSQIPSLDGAGIAIPQTASTSAKLPEWVSQHAQMPNQGPSKLQNESSPGISWLFDFTDPDEVIDEKQFCMSLAFRCSNVALIAITCAFCLLLPAWGDLGGVFGGKLLPFLVAGDLGILFLCYWTRPELRLARIYLKEYKAQKKVVHRLELSIAREESAKRLSAESIARERKLLEENLTSSRMQELAEKAKAESRMQAVLQASNKKRLENNQTEASGIRRIQDGVAYRLGALNREIAQLQKEEAVEISRKLESVQSDCLKPLLSRHRISAASIPGIGPQLNSRLVTKGIISAADVSQSRVMAVSGIGWNKALALVKWRDSIVARYKSQVPGSLPVNELAAIQAKYRSRSVNIVNERSSIERATSDSEKTLRAQFAQFRNSLDTTDFEARKRLQQEHQIVSTTFSAKNNDVIKRLVGLGEALKARDVMSIEIRGQLGKDMFAGRWKLKELKKQCAPFRRLTIREYFRVLLAS